LNAMKDDYSHEPSTSVQADLVACVGAEDYGVPGNVVRGHSASSVVRPSPRGEWLDGMAARALLGF
jgi:hypothetical protein